MTQRSRNFCFTLNNYTDDEIVGIKNIKYKYIILGDEIGQNGTKHIQGYICFHNALSFSSLKKKIPRAHIEISKGSAEQNRKYCSKEKILFEDGEIPSQGQRNDLSNIREIIKDTGKMRDVVDVATSYQSVRMAEVILKYHEPKRNWKPTVKWYYGRTGTGKSYTAYSELDDPYVCGDTNQWWEGYDAHENVIIDDFRKDFIKFHLLLKLLDRYAFNVYCKGGNRQLLAKTIIITTPKHPRDTYDNHQDEDIQQLLRRIDVIREFT